MEFTGFARMHKDIQTQHQWKFYAVPVSEFFPLGCKTTYRAYSADQVVEFVKQPKAKCLSKIGRYTGLEPVTVFCRWYPSGQCDPNRYGVEGFYLLTQLPACPVGIGSVMAPCSFKPGSALDIQKCIIEVHRKWQAFDDEDFWVVGQWEMWTQKFAPQNDNAVQFISDGRTRRLYQMPMKVILFEPARFMTPLVWLKKVGAYADYDPNFKWPELVAIATNSVASDQFNPRAPDPRVYSTLDDHIVQKKNRFVDLTALYYDVKLLECTRAVLVAFINRRIGYSGEENSTTGKCCVIIFIVYSLLLLYIADDLFH
jgi:hypothetical protein